jgi:hypothetical protein
MKMYATLDMAKPHTANISGLHLAAVTCTIVQVSWTAMAAWTTISREQIFVLSPVWQEALDIVYVHKFVW